MGGMVLISAAEAKCVAASDSRSKLQAGTFLDASRGSVGGGGGNDEIECCDWCAAWAGCCDGDGTGWGAWPGYLEVVDWRRCMPIMLISPWSSEDIVWPLPDDVFRIRLASLPPSLR